MFTKYKDGAEVEITEAYRYENGAEVEAEAAYKYEDEAEKEVWSGAYEFTEHSGGTSNGYGSVNYSGNEDFMEFSLYAVNPDATAGTAGSASLYVSCTEVDNIHSGDSVVLSAVFEGSIISCDLSVSMRCYDSSGSSVGGGSDQIRSNTTSDTLSIGISSASADVAKIVIAFNINASGNISSAHADGTLSEITINNRKCKFL